MNPKIHSCDGSFVYSRLASPRFLSVSSGVSAPSGNEMSY